MRQFGLSAFSLLSPPSSKGSNYGWKSRIKIWVVQEPPGFFSSFRNSVISTCHGHALPATNCCSSCCKKLHQWQRWPGFDELEGRSRRAVLGTHGGYRRVRGRIPGQLQIGERSISLVEGGNDMQQHRAGCRRHVPCSLSQWGQRHLSDFVRWDTEIWLSTHRFYHPQKMQYSTSYIPLLHTL